MGYIVGVGAEAIEDALTEKVDYSDVLAPFKSGSRYAVRVIPDAASYYYAHSVYKAFYTTPCTKASGEPDLYDRACDLLYKEAKELEKKGDKKKAEEVKTRANQLLAKKRYLVGFVNLDDKQPMIVDMTENQGKEIIAEMKKKAKKAGKYPFILSKEGSGQATKVSLDIVLFDPEEDDEDPLTPEQRKNFEETKDFQFDFDLFDKVLKVNSTEQQVKDLIRFGFDVSRLGIDVSELETDNEEAVEEETKTDDDLGF